MVHIINLEKRNNIPITNKYELINDSSDDIHYVLYYINEYKFNIIIRRLDEGCGWGVNLKLKIYSINNNNDNEIISLGSSEKNEKIMDIICKIKLHKVIYHSQDIPKKIIQTTYSKNIDNILHYNSIQTYIELNPEYEYYLFDNNDSRLFIKNNFDENTLIAYDLIIPGAYKADFFRYCYLYINGGCYFDCKSILRVPLRTIIHKNDKFIVCKDLGEGYYNAVLLSIPNNHLLLKTIQMCIHNIYNYKKNNYSISSSVLSFTGPHLIYSAINNIIDKNSLKFIHKNDQNKKNYYNHDYQRLFVEYNLKHIITKQYKSYNSSSGIHYSEQWRNKEVVYELSSMIDDKYKFYSFISNNTDKFDFYIFSKNILIIERIDSKLGWNDFLKIKIINEEMNKELVLNIGSSNDCEKIIYLDNDFFNHTPNIQRYNLSHIFNISICKNKYNVDKLILLHNENSGWNECYDLHIVLNNNEIYNYNIEECNRNIKIMNVI